MVRWIGDGSGVGGMRVPDVHGPLDAIASDVVWLGPDGETRQPLTVVAGTAFEGVAPVRDFPALRGDR